MGTIGGCGELISLTPKNYRRLSGPPGPGSGSSLIELCVLRQGTVVPPVADHTGVPASHLPKRAERPTGAVLVANSV